MSAYLRRMAGPGWPSGSGGAGPTRQGHFGGARDLASEQASLLDAIASLVYAVAVYAPSGECQYARVEGGPSDHARTGLLSAMEALANIVTYSNRAAVEDPRAGLGRIGVSIADFTSAAGRFELRAIRLRPGLLDSGHSVLVIADQLRDDAVERARIRERFGLTEREADVAVLLADRRRNAEIARELGISVHTARHHIERVLLKLGGCKRRDVERVLRSEDGHNVPMRACKQTP